MSEMRKKPLLFEKFHDLESNIPWIKLAPLRTHVRELKFLEQKLGINSLWVKQDGLTSPLYGGNKVRLLEFILADALKKDSKEVVATGGIGSHLSIANALFCNKLKIKPISILMDQPVTPYVRNNLLLNLHFKNEIYYRQRYIPKDETTYFTSLGGVTTLGTLGFVNAIFKLQNQINNGEMPEPDYLFVACGSSSTAAGLTIGVNITNLKTEIHFVQTSLVKTPMLNVVQRLIKRTRRLLIKAGAIIPPESFKHLIPEPIHFGGEYGIPTLECLEAIKLIKETEKIILEPTYTAKTFVVLLNFIRKNKKKIKKKTILFWNTYNSRDFSNILARVDYHGLPKNLHWVFENPLSNFGIKNYLEYIR